ncbi:MAG: radical SAM protein, partial [Pseudomonadota bacterium]
FHHLALCAHHIKQQTDLPVHAQILPPRDLAYLAELKEAGIDTVGLHIETFEPTLLASIAPAKAQRGIDTYVKAMEYAVALFGKNQVSSFIIAGLDGQAAPVIDAAEILSSMGVFPYVLPLRPIPGTPLENRRPPSPSAMTYIYEKTAEILSSHGLASTLSKAGCVRCGACSCLALFEKETTP